MKTLNTKWLTRTLLDNTDKDFVKRILLPHKYPRLSLGKDDRGYEIEGTHLMSHEKVAGKWVVYPEIINEGTELRRLGRKEAFDYAATSGEYLSFDTEEEAKWFAMNYKKAWKMRDR